MMRWLRHASLTVIALGFVAVTAFAQGRATTADLTGVVVDQSKAVLPGATVTATNVETNLTRSALTDGAGRFTIPALPPGIYTVRAELSGFAPATEERMTLALGQTAELTLLMKIAGAEEVVTVTGVTAVVDTEKTAVSTVISQKQIETLPINGRNFISFSIITPGVNVDRTPQQGASATSGLTFAGQRARSNNITVDGLDNNDAVVGSVRATFSQEAVREFQVLTNSYSAEFGKASGGVVNIVTKSGTNVITGNVFGFFRDKSLNGKGHFEQFDPAGNAVDQPKAPFNQKQFGGTIGGPVKKDETFFFASFERLDIATSNFVTIDDTTVVRNPLTGAPIGTPAQILRLVGFPVETGNVPYDVRSNQFLLKVDQQFSPNNSLYARLNYADNFNENIEPFGGIVAKSRAAVLDSKDWMFAASHTAVMSARSVNELRFQAATRDQTVNSLDPNCGGPCDSDTKGGPTLEVTGVASVGRQRFTPQPRKNTRYQVLDTISMYRGVHQFKAGFDYNYIDNKEGALPLHFGGRYIFAPLPAGALGAGAPAISPIQAVALGVPAAYVQGYGNAKGPYTYSDISLFVQDDWRLGERLTAKLGVRYQNQFWPKNSNTVPGVPDTFQFPRDNNNIAPRLAVAWDPAGDHKTSVHGAYGLFYENLITAMVGITEIIDGREGVRTFATRLPDPRVVGAWTSVGTGRKLPESVLGPFPSLVISIDPGLQTPYAHHASFGIDRELAGQLSFSANFVYARGFNQVGTIDYNPVVPALVPSGRARPLDTPGRPNSSSSVLQYTSFGETWYRGLTFAVTKRFSARSQFLGSYTVSNAEDNSTDFQSAFIAQNNGQGRDPNDVKGLPIGFNSDDERGPSLQDQRHRLVLSGLYVLPADVQVSSILTVGSGRPFNILAGVDLNGDGDGGTQSPDRARTNPTDPSTSVERNAGNLPTQATIDLRISRRFPLGGRSNVDAIFEIFNLTNRTNYTEVNNIFGTGAFPDSPLPTYGQFTQAAAPRQVQLAFKVNF
jgi:carboxypeptidase family protein/TonB-dependent receptor-like protein